MHEKMKPIAESYGQFPSTMQEVFAICVRKATNALVDAVNEEDGPPEQYMAQVSQTTVHQLAQHELVAMLYPDQNRTQTDLLTQHHKNALAWVVMRRVEMAYD